MMPAPIAERLKAGEAGIADTIEAATLVFSDVADFERLVDHAEPRAVATLLGQVFRVFDDLAAEHGLEKIRTHGDRYLCAAGVPEPRSDHARAAAAMALAMQRAVADLSDPDGRPLSLRIGMSSGRVGAGIVGTRRMVSTCGERRSRWRSTSRSTACRARSRSRRPRTTS